MIIDIALLLVMLAYVVSGFRQGLLVGALSLGGFVGGAVLAMVLLPDVVGGLQPGAQRSVLVLLGVILTAWVGQFIGALLGSRLRELVPGGPIALADHVAGAVAGLVAVALVLWFVAGAIRGGPSPALSRTVAASRVIRVINAIVPTRLEGLADAFRSAVGGTTFPRVFAGVGPENIAPVPAPDSGLTGLAVIAKDRRSIVKITGEATSCGRGQEGSGVVISAQHVVTNAHVVAGVSAPKVQVGGVGRHYGAVVVSFDPDRDLAVLYVPGLRAPALPLGQDLAHGDDAVVAGFPNDGPFHTAAARVRQVVPASGEDIYGRPGAERRVYSLYVTVEPGNSGGPLLDTQGQVVGIVFAKSLDDAHTGYALTLAESRSTIEAGKTRTVRVGSGGCAAG